jgi:TRAP-type C4-dicarboxylate transport system permease small subunit
MHSLRKILYWATGVVLFSMMLLTFADVVMRSLFHNPIGAALEVTEILMAFVVFGGMPLVSMRNQHISIALFKVSNTSRTGRFIFRLNNIVSATFFGGTAWLMLMRAERLAGMGDVTAILRMPKWPMVVLMAILLLANAIVHVCQACCGTPEVSHGNPEGESFV